MTIIIIMIMIDLPEAMRSRKGWIYGNRPIGFALSVSPILSKFTGKYWKKWLEKYTFFLQIRSFDSVNRGTCKKILLTSEGGGDGHICIEACWWVPENVKSFKKWYLEMLKVLKSGCTWKCHEIRFSSSFYQQLMMNSLVSVNL